MPWLLLVGTVIVGALAFWGFLGIWADSLAGSAPRSARATQPLGGRVATPTPVASAPVAAVVRSEAGARIQCDLLPAEETAGALADLLGEEEALAEQARERGFTRAARLHSAIATGLRDHLGASAPVRQAKR